MVQPCSPCIPRETLLTAYIYMHTTALVWSTGMFTFMVPDHIIVDNSLSFSHPKQELILLISLMALHMYGSCFLRVYTNPVEIEMRLL